MSAQFREDRITLAGLRIQPRLGVTPGERRRPQPCEADITLCGDFEAASSTDSLDRVVDYTAVLARVLEIAHAREYNLLETLAYALAREVLRAFPLQRVRVKVRKYPENYRDRLDFIEVEVEQS
jgi:7,8-dihydroneopterin aldolase/epimerase/oxygenase